MEDTQQQFKEILERLDRLEEQMKSTDKFVFPSRLSSVERRSINDAMFLSGRVTITPSGVARTAPPGLSAENIVLASYSSGSGTIPVVCKIVESSILPGTMEILFSGDIGEDVDFIVFLTTDGGR